MFDFFKNKLKQARKQTKTVTRKSSLDKVKYFKEYMDDWLQEDYIVFNEEYSFFDNNCCPNCGCVLDGEIKSSKKCPGCKEKIVLRSNKLTSKKLLLSEKDQLSMISMIKKEVK